jgi:hypothetical protein
VPLERTREQHRGERLVELQGKDRRERGRLPLAHLVSQSRPRAPLEVEADRQAGLVRGRPEPVPCAIGEIDVEDVEDHPTVADARAPLQFSRSRFG